MGYDMKFGTLEVCGSRLKSSFLNQTLLIVILAAGAGGHAQRLDGVAGARSPALDRALTVLVMAPPEVEMVRVTVSSFSGFWTSQLIPPRQRFSLNGIPAGNLIVKAEALGFKAVEASVTFRDDVVLRLEERSAGVESLPRIDQSVADVSRLAIPPKAWKEMEKSRKVANPEAAVRHLLKAIAIHHDFDLAYNDLGVQYLRLGRSAEASDAFRTALKINPGFNLARTNLAAVLLERGKANEAIHEYLRVLDREPSNLQAALGLGKAYAAIEQYVLAVKAYSRAAFFDPENGPAQFGIARSYLKLGMSRQAVPHLRKFLELEPKNASAERIKGLIAEIEGAGD